MDVFSNSRPGATGFGEAEHLPEPAIPAGAEAQPFTLEVSEDLRGKLVTAAFSRGSNVKGATWTSKVGALSVQVGGQRCAGGRGATPLPERCLPRNRVLEKKDGSGAVDDLLD